MNSLVKDSVIPNLPAIARILVQDEQVLVLQTQTALAQREEPVAAQSQSVTPSYGSFNLGLHVGDEPQQVHQNRSQLLAAINQHLIEQGRAPLRALHWLNQVHGNTVIDVDVGTPQMRARDADAMVSKAAHCGLAIMTADCVPIVLYQPSSGQIAAIHAGWQGLANGVIAETVKTFANSPTKLSPTDTDADTAIYTDTNTGNEIRAWIGACISAANYEVGGEVVDKLLAGCAQRQGLTAAETSYLRASICQAVTKAESTDELTAKYWLDLPKLARLQLEAQGIQLADDNDIPCSYAEPNYYSYRQQTHERRPATGRMALVIVRL
jgi:hypothetical protein